MKSRTPRLLLAPLVVGLLGLLAACGGQSSTPRAPAATASSAPATRAAAATNAASTRAAQGRAPAANKTAAACSLVTQDEASTAAAVPLPRQHPDVDPIAPTCEYSEEDPNGITVSVAVVPVGGQRAFQDTKAMPGSDHEDVAGVGDGAYILPGLRMIYALKGDTLLRIQIANPFLADDLYRAHLTTLAQTAVGRL